jgi:hypothetical protein
VNIIDLYSFYSLFFIHVERDMEFDFEQESDFGAE